MLAPTLEKPTSPRSPANNAAATTILFVRLRDMTSSFPKSDATDNVSPM